MPLFLTEEEVGRLLTMEAALDAVENAFGLMASQGAENRPRARARAGKLLLHVLSAASEALGYVGLKAYTTGPSGARFYFLLFDASDGRLLSLMEADRLGQIRTGAASGVATRHLARKDAARIGLIGTGWQARSQLEAVCRVRSIVSIAAYGRNPERRETFCREMSESLGVSVTAGDSAQAVTDGADIVIASTNAREPVLFGAWLSEGQHVNAIGSNHLKRQEIDSEAVTRASFIATDSLEQAKIECGDLAAVIDAGDLSWDDVHELQAVVSGEIPGRTSEADITLFESQGLAIQDVAAGKHVYERAREEGLGRELDI